MRNLFWNKNGCLTGILQGEKRTLAEPTSWVKVHYPGSKELGVDTRPNACLGLVFTVHAVDLGVALSHFSSLNSPHFVKILVFLWVLAEGFLGPRHDFQGPGEETTRPNSWQSEQLCWVPETTEPSKLTPIWKFLDVPSAQTTMGWWKEKVTNCFRGIFTGHYKEQVEIQELDKISVKTKNCEAGKSWITLTSQSTEAVSPISFTPLLF